ncbi:SDR family oxidoreductase [Antrihabitans cavernicola]|uniref:SDR family oxidoreductase n=1 Tax=Antrihabitans cavernicola TaxID=2495913 RepID=UPI003530340F
MAPVNALVTGATGYIGGRLAPRLIARGHHTRVLVRTPEKLRDVPWADDAEICEGDLGDLESLRLACKGIDVLYYLVHAMGTSGSFADADRNNAWNVAQAAKEAGVGRIVYLGGLHPLDGELSPHLRSRAEVGEILHNSGVPTVILQAGVVIGSGSASFEMIRHLTNRLPVMTTPKWVHNRIQPIAVRDVLHYLLAAAELPTVANRSYDIGGPEVFTYGDMMKIYGDVAGLSRRRILVLPVLTPHLASLWIGFVTPLPRGLAMPLIESVQCEAIAHDHDIDQVISPPDGGLTTYRDAVTLALRSAEVGEIDTQWTTTTATDAPSDPLPSDPHWAGETVYVDRRSHECAVDAATLWRSVESVGQPTGWNEFPSAWPVVAPVEAEQVDAGQFVRLRTHLKVPGRAWLELRVTELADRRSRLDQRVVYFPNGLAGRMYWYSIAPIRAALFRGMLENIAATASSTSPASRGEPIEQE